MQFPTFAPLRRRAGAHVHLKLSILLAALHGTALAQPEVTPTAERSVTGPAAATRHYDIPAGPLQTVLNRFGRDAGILLAFTPGQTAHGQSAGLHGHYGVADGLRTILQGSQLAPAPQPDGSYLLVHSVAPATSTADADMALPTVTVTASGENYRAPATASVLRDGLPSMDAAQAIGIVPAQVMRDQRPRNLDDALNNLSGISQGNTLAGTMDAVMKRGFGNNRDGSVMVDGMPLVQGRGLNATADSVELLKGPASLLYGIMDPGGVINVVPRRPSLQRATSLSLLGTTFGHGRNGGGATLDTTGRVSGSGAPGLAYRLITDLIDEDDWRNFGVQRETLVAPSLAWYGNDTQVNLSYAYRKFVYPFDRGTALDPRTMAPLAIPSRRRIDDVLNEMRGESHLAQLTVDHQFDPDWKGHAGYSYNREHYDAGQLRNTAVNPVTGILRRRNDATRGALSTDSYGIAYLSGNVRLAGMRHAVQVGMDSEYRRIYRRDMLRQRATAPFNVYAPTYGLETAATQVSASESDQTDTLHATSLFLQDSVYLTDRWILVAGARYLRYSQVAGRGRPFVANSDVADQKWLPRAGIVYKLAPELSLYGSYTQSLKPISRIAPLSGGTVSSSATAPEQAESWELGAKVELAGGLDGTLALFQIDKRNVLVSQFIPESGLIDWRTAGRARSRGVELDVTGQIGRRWNVIASYAFLDARTTEDPLYAGNRLWNVARQTASLSAVYDFGQALGADRFRLGGGVRYVGNRPGDSANSFFLPAYTLFDAFATYETRIGGQRVRFQLNARNLFNRVYYPSSVNRLNVAIGDARQISLLTTFEF
jgi:iron complex outermembrane recepter protein